jgi:hypothetical protein
VRCSCLRLSAGASLLLWHSYAPAAPGDATRLEYARSDRAAACPDQTALKSAVAKRLGYDPFFPAARQTIAVEITDSDGSLRARMQLIDNDGIIRGSRELSERAEHCDELVASLALAISIALDPSAAMGLEPDTATSASAPTDTKPKAAEDALPAQNSDKPDVPTKPAQPAPAASKRATHPQSNTLGAARTTAIGLRAAAFSSAGVAPAIAWGWRVGPSMRWAWFKLIAEFADQFAASKDAANGGGAKASLLEGSLAPCYSKGSLAGCGLLTIGTLQSEGLGIDNPSQQSSLYVGLGGRFEYTPRLVGALHLLLAADVQKSLTPITLRLRGESVWQTPFLSTTAGAGLELQFP